MSAVQLIVKRTQILLEDLGSQWTDADYIYGHLGIVDVDVEQRLQNIGLNYNTFVVILPAVPANTTDLSTFQAEGQPLFGMIEPLVVEYRLKGQSQEDWLPVQPVDKVIETDTGTGETGAAVVSDDDSVESYEWRNGIVYLSPSAVITDIRVRGQFISLLLNSDSPNQPIIGLVNVLAWATAHSIRLSRSGAAAADTQSHKKSFDSAIAVFEATQNQANHAKATRLGGRRSAYLGSGRRSWLPPTIS